MYVTKVRLFVLCTWLALLGALACPPPCACKWKSGKRHVECLDKSLELIPGPMDPESQVLDFSGNNIEVLHNEIFLKLNLSDLQKIYLPRCRIHKIDNNAFKGLANLVELDLSNNFISIIPSSNFIYIPSLMRLSLNNNPVTIVKTHCFHHLKFLNTLELSECKIEQIEMEAFSGLNHLEWLRLNGNRLSNIEGDNIFPDTLKGIDLENNQWNCDCLMKDLHDWLLKFNMPHAIEPVCSAPERLKKQKITSVAAQELACPPKVMPSSLFLETNEGTNVTLECLAKAIPEADVSWWFQGHIIRNDSIEDIEVKTLYSMIGTIDKKSELYIFNVNRDDNGTYACMANNVAGKSEANFSVKIIIKEEPVIVVVTFPRKHLVVIVTGIFLVIVLVIAIVAVVLLKFKTDTKKSRKKKNSGKEVVLSTQNSSTRNNGAISFNTLQRKHNGSIMTNAQMHHVHYTLQESDEEFRSVKNLLERNPDLINDAESIANNMVNENTIMSVYKTQNCNNEDTGSETTFSVPSMQRQVTWRDQQPPVQPCNVFQHSADVHLNPGCFLDSEGYPYDYGLPKMACRIGPMHPNYAVVAAGYQTLPLNRPKVKKNASKFAKDTEFNSQCLNYVSGNFRHTVDGYPIVHNRPLAFTGNGNMYFQANAMPPPPEEYQSEPVGMCCGAEQSESFTSWGGNPKGTCAVMVPLDISETGPGKWYHVETRCVDTQTTEPRPVSDGKDNLKPALKPSAVYQELEVYTESPDEGYVGDAAGDP